MSYDVIIIGAGGAGMMCAIEAGNRGRKVLLLDHSRQLGGKILISGGGRCNFTNTGASALNYVSQNPHFCKSALAQYESSDFIALVNKHQIKFHEKKQGQLFCDDSAKQIVEMLRTECEAAGAKFTMDCQVSKITRLDTSFVLTTSKGELSCESLVVATGGLSIPKMGATGFGYQIAEQFGIKLAPRSPALDGFIFCEDVTQELSKMSGVSVDVILSVGDHQFRENILMTHSGLSGPASLQGSLHWHPGESIEINLLPEVNLFEWLKNKKSAGNKMLVKNLLSELLPARLAEYLCSKYGAQLFPIQLPLAQISEKVLSRFTDLIHHWILTPSGTVGYTKAEVTRGGVDTLELSSKTMEAKKVKGLFFIGEVVDVTGWLGGYNFQWAWASGYCAGKIV